MPLLGADEMLATLDRLVEAAKRQTVSPQAAETVRRRMADLAPRGEGEHIADHIVVERKQDGSIAIGPESRWVYGIDLEYGTVHTRPQPFMRPAFDETTEEVLQETAQEAWVMLEREAGR